MFTEAHPDAKRVALVGCSASKLKRRAPARDLYTSMLFRAAYAFAEKTCDRIVIVSALYGAISPDEEISPYDRKLDEYGKADREAWGARAILQALKKGEPSPVFVILAGKLYADALLYGAHWQNLPHPEMPLAGLSGVGVRVRWLRDAIDPANVNDEATHRWAAGERQQLARADAAEREREQLEREATL